MRKAWILPAALVAGAVIAAAAANASAGRAEINKAVVRHYVDAFNAKDTDALFKLFATDAAIETPAGPMTLKDSAPLWRGEVESLGTTLTIESMLAEGDTVAVRYTERGTSRAPFFQHPATNRSYAIVAMEWFQLRDGRIVRRWDARDLASQAKQLGRDVAAAAAAKK